MVGYYVIMSEHKDLTAQTQNSDGFIFFAKTADFQFKIEPEKTIDLDDGNQEVGSVKISWSFSILQRWEDSATRYLHLLPVDYNNGTMYTFDMRRMVPVVQALESQTGEFEKTQVSAVVRVPIEAMEGVFFSMSDVQEIMVVIVMPASCVEIAIYEENEQVGDVCPSGDKTNWGIAYATDCGHIDLELDWGDELVKYPLPDGGFYVVGEDRIMRRVG